MSLYWYWRCKDVMGGKVVMGLEDQGGVMVWKGCHEG